MEIFSVITLNVQRLKWIKTVDIMLIECATDEMNAKKEVVAIWQVEFKEHAHEYLP